MKNKTMFFLPSLNGGGAERVTLNIIKQLSIQDHEVHLVLVQKVGEYLNLVPKHVKIHDLESSKTLYSIYKLRKLIKTVQPNVVYSTLYRTHIALYLGLLYMQSKPYTILRMPNSPKLIFEHKQLSQSMYWLLHLALKKADLVLAQTPEMKKEITTYHHIKQSKIKHMINPLDKGLINSSTKDEMDLFNSNHINVLASGRIMYQKGYDILIHAFQQVYLANTNYRLYIIGGDYHNLQKEYQLRIEELGLQHIIHFLGFQKNPYIYYKNADLFVMSSRWEGLPNTILENLYLKKPIVATNCIPFMETLIKHEENGFLVEPENVSMLADAILQYKKLKNLGALSYLEHTDINQLFQKPTGALKTSVNHSIPVA